MHKAKLTRKQFYSRAEMLIKAGLVKRKKGRYLLTSLGKLINDISAKVESALSIEWKLKAIDSIVMSSSAVDNIPKEEHVK